MSLLLALHRVFLFIPRECPISLLLRTDTLSTPSKIPPFPMLEQEAISHNDIAREIDVYRNKSPHSQATSIVLQFSWSLPEPVSKKSRRSESAPLTGISYPVVPTRIMIPGGEGGLYLPRHGLRLCGQWRPRRVRWKRRFARAAVSARQGISRSFHCRGQ